MISTLGNTSKMQTTYTIIGSGNIAHWMAYTIHQSGGIIKQVYSRQPDHASALSSPYAAEAIHDLSLLKKGSHLYLFALNDEAYLPVLQQLPFKIELAVHTAGSVSQDLFKGYADRYGVIYPYQSISRQADWSRMEVPLCIEAVDDETRKQLLHIAREWGQNCYLIDEQQRGWLHVAAVFASNFVNALYGIGYELLEEHAIDPGMLYPLLQNTLKKIERMPPVKSQTGPAVREEAKTMEKHLAMLQDERLKELYTLLSNRIITEKYKL